MTSFPHATSSENERQTTFYKTTNNRQISAKKKQNKNTEHANILFEKSPFKFERLCTDWERQRPRDTGCARAFGRHMSDKKTDKSEPGGAGGFSHTLFYRR